MVSNTELEELYHNAVSWSLNYQNQLEQQSVQPSVEAFQILREEALKPEDSCLSTRAVFQLWQDRLAPALCHWNHPRFHAYFNSSSNPTSGVAEMLAAVTNQQAMLWKTSPAATELEILVTQTLLEWLGLGSDWGQGFILDSASMVTLHALIVARYRAYPEILSKGSSGKTFRVYASEFAHSSVLQAVRSLGFGEDNLVLISCDKEGAPVNLEEQLAHDKEQGLIPCALVLTLGSTAIASIDHHERWWEIAKKEKLFVHVDAAYGGSACLLPENKAWRKILAQADSFVWNPHKWFFQPMDCSLCFVRNPEEWKQVFSLNPSYLSPESSDSLDLKNTGIPLGRRFRSLKLWFFMRTYGRLAILEKIRSHIKMAEKVCLWVEEYPILELVHPVTLSLVVISSQEVDIADWCRKLNNQGYFVSTTEVSGRLCLRIVFGSWYHDQEHCDQLIQDMAATV